MDTIEDLKRRIGQLERDNKMLKTINENSEKLRQTYEKEKNLQYLYNDLLLIHCPNMIFLFNDKLKLVINSSMCLPFLKYIDKDDLTNLPLKEIFSSKLNGEWIEKIYDENNRTLTTKESIKYDDTITLNDDDFMHVQVTINPVVNDNDECIGTIMSINDITELVESNIKAEAAAKSKSDFLANMSHEIRTPMNAVKGLSELLSLTELTGLQRNYVDNIINSANSLLSIINDVLDFSKIDADKIELIEGPFQLSELISSVANMVSMRAEDKDLEMMVDVDPNLPSTIKGDDVRIKQIITNLLSNAVKYTDNGYVKLKINVKEEKGTNWLYCEVQDTGIGIKEEDMALLFDAFARADQNKNRSIAGTGLGLSISKQLTTAMGGDIWVRSVYGEGSTFGFKIPVNIVDQNPVAQIEDKDKINILINTGGDDNNVLAYMLDNLGVKYSYYTSDTPDSNINDATHYIFDEKADEKIIQKITDIKDCPTAVIKDMRHAMDLKNDSGTVLYLPLFIVDLAKFLNGIDKKDKNNFATQGNDIKTENVKVMVVDDNDINLIVSGEMLSSFDAEVVLATSGEEAIEKADKEKFDLIFMDHMMPGMDGIETTEYIRNHYGMNRVTPIIALTANVVNDMKSKYMESGMNDFIGKPIEFSDLNRVLKNWLPVEKQNTQRSIYSNNVDQNNNSNNTMSPNVLVAALDNFGLYTTDVLKEMSGDFDGYINRMEKALEILENLTERLKKEVQTEDWEIFTKDILDLRNLLYGIGARDCAGRARNLAIAAKDGNIPYIHGDFYSLMGNMYMLDKKLDAIVPVGKGGSMEENPLNTPQYLYGVLEKMGRAIAAGDAVDAMSALENAATFSLDKDLDMGLKEIKNDLEKGDFNAAGVHHADTFDRFVSDIMKSE